MSYPFLSSIRSHSSSAIDTEAAGLEDDIKFPNRVHPLVRKIKVETNEDPAESFSFGRRNNTCGGDISPVSSARNPARRRSRSSCANPAFVKKKTFDFDIQGLNARGEGVKQALSFLEAQDPQILHCVGESVGWLLHDVGVSSMYEISSGKDSNGVCTAEEIKALSVLAMSRNVSLRQVAGNVIREIASKDGIARGKNSTGDILNRATEMIRSEIRPLQVFAIRAATSLALKGPIWCERLVEKGWLTRIIEIINSIFRQEQNTANNSLPTITEERGMYIDPLSPMSGADGNSEEERKDAVMEEYRFFDHNGIDQDDPDDPAFLPPPVQNSAFQKVKKENGEVERLHIHGEKKRVLKLALKLVGTLNLVQMERGLKRKAATADLSASITHKRNELMGILSNMCKKSSSVKDTSLVLLLCSAMNSFICDLGETEWTAEFSSQFVSTTLQALLDRAQEATSEIHTLNSVLSRTIPTDQASIEKEETRKTRSSFALNHDLKTSEYIKKLMHLTSLSCEAIKVVRAACRSRSVACFTTERFDEWNVMRVLTVLYRSQFPGTKAEVAMFLHALCANVTDRHKVLLCESGTIVRLLRLASPSAVYGAYDSRHGHADECAFIPAIQALAELGKVDIIGARIILAGGLGPLYSHANSNRKTRKVAREALDTLGVTDLNEVLGIWTDYRRQKDCSNVELDSDAAVLSSTPPFVRTVSEDQNNVRIIRSQSIVANLKRHDGLPLLVDFDKLQPPVPYETEDIWDKGLVLGSGAFSTVYRCTVRSHIVDPLGGNDFGWKPVAVKKYNDAGLMEESFLSEIKVLSKVPPHRNITALYGAVILDRTVLLITELGGPHTLAWHLASLNRERTSRQRKNLFNSWNCRTQILVEIADALKHLQSLTPPILHLDLKSSNVLLSEAADGSFTPKLCDFGLAVELKAGYEFLSPANSGTLQWMAPEVMHDEDVELSRGFDQSADVFSFAILMWELAHPGRVPWDELSIDANLESIQVRIRQMVCSGRRLTCYDTGRWPAGYEELMRKCWRQMPSERPCFVRSFLSDPDSVRWSTDLKALGGGGDCIPVALKRILAFCTPMSKEIEFRKAGSDRNLSTTELMRPKERRRSSRPANTIAESLSKLTSAVWPEKSRRRRRGTSIE